MKAILIIVVLLVSGCSGGSVSEASRKVSRAAPIAQPSMTYEQFRHHMDAKAASAGGWEQMQRHQETQEGNRALHKRFMVLDRDNNGRLSPDEFNGY